MPEKPKKAPNYIVGYDWGRVEVFDHSTYLAVFCQAKLPSGWYSANVSKESGSITIETSMGIDRNYHSNPAHLCPNIVPLVKENQDLPPEISDLLLAAFSD